MEIDKNAISARARWRRLEAQAAHADREVREADQKWEAAHQRELNAAKSGTDAELEAACRAYLVCDAEVRAMRARAIEVHKAERAAFKEF